MCLIFSLLSKQGCETGFAPPEGGQAARQDITRSILILSANVRMRSLTLRILRSGEGTEGMGYDEYNKPATPVSNRSATARPSFLSQGSYVAPSPQLRTPYKWLKQS